METSTFINGQDYASDFDINGMLDFVQKLRIPII